MNYTIKTCIAGSLLEVASISLSAQTAFRITWNLKDTCRNGEKATLSYFNGVKKVYTAATVKDGVFTIEGSVIDPARATLIISTIKKGQKPAIPWRTTEKCEFFI